MSEHTNKAATIKDIARVCEVSVTTVSRVLSNNGYPVSRELSEKIIKAAQQLNYTPNLFARGLKTNESSEIAVLIPSITNPFYTSLVSGIENNAVKEGYNIIFYNTNNSNLSEERIIKSILGKRIGGMIISTGSDNISFTQGLQDRGAPSIKIVLVDYAVPGSSYSSVYFDYRKGSMMGVEYLISKGHSKIVYAGLEPISRTRLDRINGFKDAMSRAGFALNDKQILLYGQSQDGNENIEFRAGNDLAQRISKLEDRPTAVVAVNDMVAFGILHYFNKNRIKVPEDISVLGFDDGLFCEVSCPPLTTVRVPSKQMGEMAARLLLDDLKSGGGGSGINLTMEPVLVERSTVSGIR